MKNKLVINYRAVTFILIGLTVGVGLDSLAQLAIELTQNHRYAFDPFIAFFFAYVGAVIIVFIGTVNSFFWGKWLIEVVQQFLKVRQFNLYWQGVGLWVGSLVTLLGLMILSSLHLLVYLSWGSTVLSLIGLLAIFMNVLTFLILLVGLGLNPD